MNDANHEPEIDLLDRATAALRNAAVFESPPQPIVAATIAAVNQRFTETKTNSPEIVRRNIERRQRMFRIARYGSLAAAVLLMAIGASVVLLSDRAASVAFGQVVENVKSAKSVSFTSIQKMSQQSPTLEFKFYLQGEQMRVELPGKQKAFDAGMPIVQATTADSRTRNIMEINYSTKTARKYKLDEATAKQFANPIDGFRDLTEKDAELIGEEELAGQKTQLYRIKKLSGLMGISGEMKDGESCKAWVDPKTGLPIKITLEASFSRDKENKGSLVFEDFKWNEKLDKELFEPRIPEGFKVSERNGGGDEGKSSSATAVPFPFSLVVDNVKKATTVTFKQHWPGGEVTKFRMERDHVRTDFWRKDADEIGGAPVEIVATYDIGKKEILDLNYLHKFATRIHHNGEIPFKFLSKFQEDLSQLAQGDAHLIGGQKLEGRDMRVYQLTSFDWNPWNYPGGNPAKLWADNTTNLPARIEIELPDRATVVLDKFVWDDPLDAASFNPEIPEGFKISFSGTPAN